jgi:hypothetical protein
MTSARFVPGLPVTVRCETGAAGEVRGWLSLATLAHPEPCAEAVTIDGNFERIDAAIPIFGRVD